MVAFAFTRNRLGLRVRLLTTFSVASHAAFPACSGLPRPPERVRCEAIATPRAPACGFWVSVARPSKARSSLLSRAYPRHRWGRVCVIPHSHLRAGTAGARSTVRATPGIRHRRVRYRRVSRCPRVFGSRGVTQLHVLCFIRIRAVRGIHPGRERRIQPPFAWTRFRGHSCDPGVHHDIRVSHGVPGTRARRGGPSRSPQRASPPPQRGDPTRRLRTRQLRMPPGHLCSVRYRAWRASARVTRRGTHRRGDTTTASQT